MNVPVTTRGEEGEEGEEVVWCPGPSRSTSTGSVLGSTVVEDGTRACFPISKNVEGVETTLVDVFLIFLIFFNPGGDMKSVISLPELRSNLLPKLSLVMDVGLRARGFMEVLATGLLVVIGVVGVVVVVVVVGVVIVVVDFVVVVVVD